MEKILNEKIVEVLDRYFETYLSTDIRWKFHSRYVKDNLKKVYHYLFDHIDWELKLNDNLNVKINNAKHFKDVINFDISQHFYRFDENENKIFDQNRKDRAIEFCNSWPAKRRQYEKEIDRLQNKKCFKTSMAYKLNGLMSELQSGNSKYRRLQAIFDLEEEYENSYIDKMKEELQVLETDIIKTINEVMLKHILEMLQNNPEVIFSGKIFEKYENKLQSSAFLANENNKNLSEYFNSKVLNQKLDSIFDEYIELKGLEKQDDGKYM